jgi:hypothetical protein
MAHIPRQVTVLGAVNRVAAVPAKGFYVEPLTNVETGNPVRFPITVRFNGDAATDLVVADGRARYLVPGTMDVVGGTVGDRWRVTFLETDADGLGGGDSRQELPAVIAQKVIQSGDGGGDQEGGQRFYVLGAAGNTAETTPGYEATATPGALDVSGYTHLLLYAKTTAPDVAAELNVDLELLDGPGAGANVIDTLSAVLTGATSVTYKAAVGPGLAAYAGWVVMPLRSPYVRLSYVRDTAPVSAGSCVRLLGMK